MTNVKYHYTGAIAELDRKDLDNLINCLEDHGAKYDLADLLDKLESVKEQNDDEG